ncbi:MAG: DUF3187 family protein, partial [Nitrospiraceae bacterium]
LLVGILFCLPLSARADGFGPFPVRNFQALNLLVLAMPGERASVLKKGTLDFRLELAETSNIARDETDQAVARMKYETLRTGAFLRYGLTDRFEVAAEIPVLYRWRGFMEGAITTVERATTGVAPARTALKGFGYVFDVRSGSRTLFAGNEGDVGLGDISLYSKYQVMKEGASAPAIALRMAVKLPTGDESRVFGSGHPDVGVGFALEKTLASRFIVYGNINGVFPTGRIAGLPLQPVVSGLVAIEYLWSNNLSFTAQFDYYSSPYHGTGTQVLDKGVTESVVGFSYRVTPNFLWQLYGIENLDLIRGSAADVTISTVFTYRFPS